MQTGTRFPGRVVGASERKQEVVALAAAVEMMEGEEEEEKSILLSWRWSLRSGNGSEMEAQCPAQGNQSADWPRVSCHGGRAARAKTATKSVDQVQSQLLES